MIKSILITIVILFLGFFLQIFLIETSPIVKCDEIFIQLIVLLKTLIIEYIIIFIIQFFILKIGLMINFKIMLICALSYTLIYIIFFANLFYNYSIDCGCQYFILATAGTRYGGYTLTHTQAPHGFCVQAKGRLILRYKN